MFTPEPQSSDKCVIWEEFSPLFPLLAIWKLRSQFSRTCQFWGGPVPAYNWILWGQTAPRVHFASQGVRRRCRHRIPERKGPEMVVSLKVTWGWALLCESWIPPWWGAVQTAHGRDRTETVLRLRGSAGQREWRWVPHKQIPLSRIR